MTTVNLDEQFEKLLKWNKSVSPQPALLVLKDDPVAMAMSSYRMWATAGVRWAELENVTVTGDDRVQANDLRKYYAGQMTVDALKGSGLKTTFRRKLYAIATNCHEYTKDDIGLLYRLPYLYEEDLTLDQLMSEFVSVQSSMQQELRGVFSLHKKMLHSRRSGDYYHYWLKQAESQYLYKLVVKATDPLKSLVESLLQQPREYTAFAYYKCMQGQRRFNYIHLGNMQLV